MASDGPLDSPNDPRRDDDSDKDKSELTASKEDTVQKEGELPSRPERSASRGRSHVDKSIQVTLADPEPAKNARSRKSSHFMGLFKDSATSREVTHDENREKIPLEGKSISRSPRSPAEYRPLLERTLSAGAILEPSEVSSEHTGIAFRPGFLTNRALQEEPSSAISSEPVSPGRLSTGPASPYEEDERTPKNRFFRSLPQSLLEEIRQHHGLRSWPAIESFSTAEVDQIVRHHAAKSQEAAKTKDEDEEEEHMSALTYYPHAAPSQEEVDLDESVVEEIIEGAKMSSSDGATVSLKSASRRSSAEMTRSEHVDISLKSKNRKNVFHGDYTPLAENFEDAGPRKLSTIREYAVDTPSSASESEQESSDDLSEQSETEAEETTPTATPTMPSHTKSIKTDSPRGIVRLEPYSHQVGGHTTLFRFSRNAVCKELNNRENEFYERIERRHPDMLQFLPRFATLFS